MMKIEDLIKELKNYGVEEKFEPVYLHSTKIKLMIKTIETQQRVIKEQAEKAERLHFEILALQSQVDGNTKLMEKYEQALDEIVSHSDKSYQGEIAKRALKY